MSARVHPRPVLRVTQFIVTAVLTVWLLRSIEWLALGEIVVRAQWLYIGLAWLCVLISHLINVVRWRFLLQVDTVSYPRLLVYYGAGLFANNWLPTGIGGDGVRVALLSREVSLARALRSVGLDRSIGLISYSAIVLIGLGLGLPPDLEVNGAGSIDGGLVMGSLMAVIVAGLFGRAVAIRSPGCASMCRNGALGSTRMVTRRVGRP